MAAGEPIAYTWTENDVPEGYVVSDPSVTGTVTSLTNTYVAEGSLAFAGTKTMANRDFQAGDVFTFTITADDEAAPLPPSVTVTIAPTEGQTVPLDFGVVTFGLDDAGKTYTYTIAESGEADGVVNDGNKTVVVSVGAYEQGRPLSITTSGDDSTKLAFVNTYEAVGLLKLAGKKALEGRELAKNDVFEFRIDELVDDEYVPVQTVTNTGATIDYPELSYTLDDLGTHIYRIYEEQKRAQGIKSDGMSYDLTVRVTDDTKDGELEIAAVGASPQALDFTNTYRASTRLRLTATKIIEGRSFAEGDSFTFVVSARGENVPLPSDAVVTIKPTTGDKAVIDFGNIEYTQADAGNTYTYLIEEKANVAGVTNDAKNHEVDVTVVDNGDGTLLATPTYRNDGEESEGGIAFVNTYDAQGTATVEVRKSVEGRDWNDGESHEFELGPVNDAPMPEEGGHFRHCQAHGQRRELCPWPHCLHHK